ncbi:PH domain-containing protein [Acidovorax sp. sic0104]|uniref:PH domain-containing protein n=1 Tax=Acidovorax sp. sic0104 TaxID=2854784 RepID=UPI001C44FDB0|nr:PH domain-containing protein [Acidovorax sp. sic0104]MBV7540353.1 PH domain-containing protein [Acidovorax sp. sic0104]
MSAPRAFFTSRVDSWLFAIGPLAGLFAISSVALTAVPFALDAGVLQDKTMMALIAVVFALTLLLPLWLLLDTNYTVTADELLVRSGPFRWRIALGQVHEVLPARSWRSSPALSLDRLRIRYGQGRSILVSPREKQRFVDTLRERCPSLLTTGF